MNKLVVAVLVVSILGNIGGLFFAYQYWQMKRQTARLQNAVKESEKMIATLSDIAEKDFAHRMVFLHHSVGKGILEEGKLRDSLQQMGIAVKGMTYGDSVGQYTDMCNWLPKFQNDMKGILQFKNHPNVYYTDGRVNDIVMFKSCFPNSDIGAEGAPPGDPASPKKTLANYRAVVGGLAGEIRKYPNTLFIYMTFPPLVPLETTPESAARARAFNVWLKGEFLPGYIRESGLHNLVIFDLFDILADSNNVLREDYRRENPRDSHPNALANREAARRFMEFFQPVWTAWQSTKSPQPVN
ncbi:MAG: LapA family protein [candidate division Zixibacteria bacterium]|nr:LapA family protein [candidate division Zixibacteria bacterium]